MAAPEWHGGNASIVNAPAGSAPSGSAGVVPSVAGAVVGAAGVLVSLCGGFFAPVVLAQLDAALAHQLAATAREHAAGAAGLVDQGAREGRSAAYLEQQARHASACQTAATKAGQLADTATEVVTAFGGRATGAGFDPGVVDQVSGEALVDVIARLEEAKNALTAVQIQAETLFTAQQRLSQARTGVPKAKLGKGVALQIGLARHESAHRGRQLTELAAVLVRELPHTMNAITAGVIGEEGARIVATETVFLSAEHRAAVDALISADPDQLATLGNRELATRARRAAYALEPEVFTARREKAVSERHVSLRPAADGMTLLSALVPLKHGVAIYNTLTQVSDTAKAGGDGRGRGQLMADALIHRLIHHAPCDHRGTPPTPPTPPTPEDTGQESGGSPGAGLCTTVTEPSIMLELVMTDRALFDGANDPAILVGHEPIPAPEARTLVLAPETTSASIGAGTSAGTGSGAGGRTGPAAPSAAQLWVKRLFTHPDSGALLAMDSRARLFPEGIKEFLRLQYQRCATPYCDAPIRQYDHIKSWAAGGTTTTANGQGLCGACNQDKEAPGWTSAPTNASTGAALPQTRVTTPTGHHYVTTAPPLPGPTRRQRPRRC